MLDAVTMISKSVQNVREIRVMSLRRCADEPVDDSIIREAGQAKMIFNSK